MRVVFLVSGGGGNLKFLYHYAALKESNIDISVVADRDCGALVFAKKNNIRNFKVNYTKSYTKELTDALGDICPDVIITNWHKIIDEQTVALYQGRLINLHYSLLPAFSGLIGVKPIELAYEQGCKFIGPTCHLVDAGVDTGKILSQAIFKTNIPLAKAIETMFKSGCLALLSGIEILKNGESENSSVIYHLDPMDKNISKSFWDKVGAE